MNALEIIKQTMSEFADVSDEKIELFVSLSESLISERKFGKLYQQALALLVAHKMKMAGLGSTVGVGKIGDTIGLSSVSEGETSVSFSNSQSGNLDTNAEYGLTVYGMQFLSLKKRCVIPIVSAGVGAAYGSKG